MRITPKNAETLWAFMDTDHDGVVSTTEFSTGLNKLCVSWSRTLAPGSMIITDRLASHASD